ncbi:MAG: B12-binding domain-containing radical SAM protein [Proteobacteria bacterium]|nr:B12-binding domain-containing radical SAM protein [Pseudomonadota bacterium]
MKILLVYSAFPVSYWGFQHSMPLIGRKASLAPLGLITLAALLPRSWQPRLIDLNVRPLDDQDLLWAEVVFVGGMRIQAPSMHEVVRRARAFGRRTVVGGPAPTTTPEEFADADVVFCGEAEGRIDELVAALTLPRGERRVLVAEERPPLASSPIPRFELLDLEAYASISVQYSRGCPFQCEFCDIIEIFGRVPRVKAPAQVLAELDALYACGYRGSVFFVDDNFIGNKASVRALLAALEPWQRARDFPFELYTEASVNLAADSELVSALVRAGFTAVFLGIETPSATALAAAGKRQNLALDLHEAVERLTAAGLEVMGGFIVGFDSDGVEAFAAQRAFLDGAPLPLAMIGLLIALPGTALWRRLAREGRLRSSTSGDHFARPNFEPAMDEALLLSGYAALLAALYSPAAYYARCAAFVGAAPRLPGGGKRLRAWHLMTMARCVWQVGIRAPYRLEFWRLLARALRQAPHQLTWVVGHVVMGEHMIRYTREQVLPRLAQARAELALERAAAADAPGVPAPARRQGGAPRSGQAAAVAALHAEG